MAENENIKTARDGIALIGEVMKIAGENPNVKAAGNNLGQAALTITKTINNALLPLAAVNFAIDKAKLYFENKFSEDLSNKTKNIPPEEIVTPKPSIAGPALQGLAFSHEEENLKQLYLSLLATSMDGRVASEAHPAFVEIIKQLTSEEADLIRGILLTPSAQPIAEVRLTAMGEPSYTTLQKHLLNSRNAANGLPVENSRISSMVENWIRLGIVEVDYKVHLRGQNQNFYSWVYKRPELVRFRESLQIDSARVVFTEGIIQPTSLGARFSKAVGLNSMGSLMVIFFPSA